MKPTVYLETTIPSYLTGWPSRNLIRAVEQQYTRDWWATRDHYELRVSTVVLTECAAGDPQASADRLAALAGVVVLTDLAEVEALTTLLIRDARLPPNAAADAAHIAAAAVHGIRFLLTWNAGTSPTRYSVRGSRRCAGGAGSSRRSSAPRGTCSHRRTGHGR